jgi:hypothetical protein
MVAAFAVILLAVSGTAAGYVFLSRDSASRPATAEVNGLEYSAGSTETSSSIPTM